jgi:hypothetical protein
MSEFTPDFDPEETDDLFEDEDDLESEFEIVDPIYGVEPFGEELGGGTEPVPDEEEDFDFDLEETQHPCFRFPKLGVPDFGKLPKIVIRGPSCCGATGEPILATIGRLGKNIGDLLSLLGPVSKLDKTHPRTSAGLSTAKTIVSTPADPQHISREVVAIAPEVALDLLTDFITNTLVSAATSLTNLFGIINAVSEKADALGDAAAKAIGDKLAFIAAAAEAALTPNDYILGKIGAKGLAAANQAAAIGGVRQIPFGINSPNSGRRPTLMVASDANLRSQWPQRGTLRSSVKQNLTNAANMAVDMAMAATGMCWAGSAMRVLANATGMLAQGLGRDALGMQIEGMLRMSVFHPLNIVNGLKRLAHSWRHECKIKLEFDGHLFPPLPSLAQLKAKLRSALNGSCAASLPGNLMYAAYGDNEPPEGSRIIQQVPTRVAANLGVQNSDVQLISFYVTDPDKKYNNLTTSLPGIYQSGDPKLAEMRRGLQTLQDVLIYVDGLTLAELKLLAANQTAVGGPVLAFVKSVPGRKNQIGDFNNITSSFMNNRMTNAQMDALNAAAAAWDDLNPDLTVIENEEVRTIVSRIFSPRLAVLGFTRLSTILSEGRANLDSYGGHIGPEIAYAAANQAAMTRCLLILNDDGHSDQQAFDQVVEIMVDASKNQKDELTYGGAMSAYIDDVADAGLELKENGGSVQPIESMNSMARAGLPDTIQAAKDFAETSHIITSTLNSMMAETRDMRAYDIGKAANDIKVTDKNADTQAYISGALNRQKEATKTILTTSLVNMSAAATAIATAGISDKPNNRKEFVERIVKETANALAFMTLDKTTGVKLNQIFEGVVTQAKFMLNQAGTSMANEAPVIRNSARMLVNQGQIVITEGDALDFRGRWLYQLIEQSYGVLTGDYHVAANGKLVQTASEQSYFGQTGTTMADLVKMMLAVGPAGAGAQMRMDATGSIKMFALTEIKMSVGLCSMTIGPARVDINPTIPSPLTPNPVNIQYAAMPTMTKVDDKAPAKLPQEPGSNSIPVAAPYKSPMSFNPLG